MIVISSALVLGALPIFLIGGLAVQIRLDLGFDEAVLGAVVTAGFAVGAIAAPFGGRLADRFGSRTAVFSGAALSVVALAGIGVFATTWWHLAAFLAIAGLAVAIIDPGLAILVGRVIQPGRQGFAFGVKEASIPAATLVAGIAVPAVGLTVGWRWAFLIGAVPLAIVVVFLPKILRRPAQSSTPETRPAPRADHLRRAPLIGAALAALLGSASASGVGVFLTESAVAMGISEAASGILLAVGSLAGIVARIGAGVIADRRGGTQFRFIATMLAGGAAAIAFGATGNPALLVLGTIGAFTGGWAWTGIFFLSLVRTSPATPGAAAGIGTASLGLGNAIGPLLFGVIAQAASFQTAWLAAGAAAGGAALLMTWAAGRLE